MKTSPNKLSQSSQHRRLLLKQLFTLFPSSVGWEESTTHHKHLAEIGKLSHQSASHHFYSSEILDTERLRDWPRACSWIPNYLLTTHARSFVIYYYCFNLFTRSFSPTKQIPSEAFLINKGINCKHRKFLFAFCKFFRCCWWRKAPRSAPLNSN